MNGTAYVIECGQWHRLFYYTCRPRINFFEMCLIMADHWKKYRFFAVLSLSQAPVKKQ